MWYIIPLKKLIKFSKVLDHLKRWYEGTPMIRIFKNPANGNVPVLPLLYEKRHWTAQIAKVLAKFFIGNWKWIFKTLILLASLFLAVAQFIKK